MDKDQGKGVHDEVRAVAQRYARRGNADLYSASRPEVRLLLAERQRAWRSLWAEQGLSDLSQLRLVEVGSGTGGNLAELMALGFAPGHMQGIELLPERHQHARATLPAALQLSLGDARMADIAPGSQDLVLASTLFSSLLDREFQQSMADTMWRWLKPGGAVLWYDFSVNNPRNPDVRGVPLKRVRELFGQAAISHRRVTLAPPLARLLCRVHPGLYGVFNALPSLRTHIAAMLNKPGP